MQVLYCSPPVLQHLSAEVLDSQKRMGLRGCSLQWQAGSLQVHCHLRMLLSVACFFGLILHASSRCHALSVRLGSHRKYHAILLRVLCLLHATFRAFLAAASRPDCASSSLAPAQPVLPQAVPLTRGVDPLACSIHQ